MSLLSENQVAALAPDPASAKAARALANTRHWVRLGRNEQVAWGECQGSGRLPYQTRIDLQTLAFSCSCPSRKFPCKHGLGLGLLLASSPQQFSSGEPPEWVRQWLSARQQRAEKKQAHVTAPPDAAAAAKRAAARETKVAAGLDQLELWLCDLLRLGIASAPSQDYAFWDRTAARLVDAQAPGLARLVRGLAGIASSGVGWEERFLHRLGLLCVLMEGYRRGDALPDKVREDVRAAIGFNVSQDEINAQEGTSDEWITTGRVIEGEDRLRVQRTWLWGRETRRFALLLDFAAGSGSFPNTLPAGSAFRGEVVFYPAAYPLRAVLKNRSAYCAAFSPQPQSLAVAHRAYREAVAEAPWLSRYPMLLGDITAEYRFPAFQVRDGAGRRLPLRVTPASGWKLLALAGGAPIPLFGEWDGSALRPLTAWPEDIAFALEGSA